MRDTLAGCNLVEDGTRRNARNFNDIATSFLVHYFGVAGTVLEHVVRCIRMVVIRAIITSTLFLAKEMPKVHAILSIKFIFQGL